MDEAELRRKAAFIVLPIPDAKYRTSESFFAISQQYQWSLGFSDTATETDSSKVVMTCATDSRCPYHIRCDRTPARVASANGSYKSIWVVSSSGYCSIHNHVAPYIPIDPYAETRRRASLAPDDGQGRANSGLVPSSDITRLILSINPTFTKYLPTLEYLGINNMSIQELVDMSSSDLSGALRDNSNPHSPILELHIAELLEGFRLARKRKEEGEATWDGRIVRGTERERLLGVIQEAMEKGRLAMEAAGVEVPTV